MARERRGYSGHKVAAQTGVSLRTLQRIEKGPTPVSAGNLALLCSYYQIGARQSLELQKLRGLSRRTGWWNDYHDLVDKTYAEHCEAEQQAIQIDHFGSIIPGLFQTEEYAGRIQAKGFIASAGEIAERYVALRLRRKQEFLRGPLRKTRLILDLYSIQHPFYLDLIKDQLEHIQALQDQGYLELRLIPETRHNLPSIHFINFVFGNTNGVPALRRSIACNSSYVAETHHEEALQITASQKYFEDAWNFHAVPLSEVSLRC
jgi:transcriptional regulator with XRE-family HTH domain